MSTMTPGGIVFFRPRPMGFCAFGSVGSSKENPRAPNALCLSEDDGKSFPKRMAIENGPDTCRTNNSVDEVPYPMLFQHDDDNLELAYAYHRRAIKHVRLTPDWLKEYT